MKKPLRVIIVEDSEDDVLLVLRELKAGGYAVTHLRVETWDALSSALQHERWDVIISDHHIPGFGSLQALDVLKETGMDIPFIVVSGVIGEEVAVKLMKAGASDYVMKGHLARLVPSIDRELREAHGRQIRRQAEEDLVRSQRELHDFFERATVGLHWVAPDGTILRVNQAELDILGFTQEEYLGRRISGFYVRPEVGEETLRRLASGEPQENFEAELLSKNGAIKHVLLTSDPVGDNGRLIRSNCFMNDISDRKRGDTAMVHLAAIVESSEDAIIGKTLDGTVQSWNRGAEQMYGYKAEEVIGRSTLMLVSPGRAAELLQVYARIKSGERVERFETVRLRKDGTPIDVSLTLSAIKDKHGTVTGVSAIERDITLRKREEEERVKLINELTEAFGNIKTLRGLLPICASCKKIRDDHGYWQKVESYISAHSEAAFTHGICPDCMKLLYPEYKVSAGADRGK